MKLGHLISILIASALCSCSSTNTTVLTRTDGKSVTTVTERKVDSALLPGLASVAQAFGSMIQQRGEAKP